MSEERFRIAQDLSPDGFAILRPVRNEHGGVIDFTLAYQNDAIARMTGTDPGQSIGRRLLDIFPSLRGSPVLRECQQAAETGRFHVLEGRYGGGTTPPAWYRVVVVPMGGDVVVLAQDMTGRNHAEEELRKESERLRLAKTAAHLGIYDHDLVSGAIEWDERVREIWGVGPEVPITMDLLLSGIHPDDRARIQSGMKNAIDSKGHGNNYVEYRVVNLKDKTEAWIRTTGHILRDSGRPVRFIGTVEDITHRKRMEEELRASRDELELRVQERTADLQDACAKLTEEMSERLRLEEQLRQSQKMEALGTLTGGIAHDFNNILAAIIGFTQLLADHVTEGSRGEGYVERVLQAGLRGRELVKQMLAFSRRTQAEKKPSG